MNPMLGVLAHVHYALGILLVVTVALLTWHHVGMEHVKEFNVVNSYTLTGDDSENKGASVARLERDGQTGLFHCELVQQYKWPYCRLRLLLGTDTEGIDLSGYDRMTLDLSYDGPGPHGMRVALVDYEPGISDPANWWSNKVNEIEAFTVPEHGQVEVPMNLFYPASWWKQRVKRPLLQTGTRLDNVISIDLMTDANNTLGTHLVTVRSVRFYGKWISTTNLLMGLVALWILAAIGWPAMAALALRRQLNTSKAELILLSEVNKALQLETQELVGQAYTDPLTGVLNRQGLRAALMGSSGILTDPMCVIFIDIDHFKRINDTHGHAVGDDVLRQFARVIASDIRTTDKLVRWGGEEFLLVCSNTNVAQAAALAEKLRHALHHQGWPVHLRVTASFGVAEHVTDEEFSDVIERADAALYSAKLEGRDRVHADGLPKPPGQAAGASLDISTSASTDASDDVAPAMHA
jgi:diguanylate cyclase (GGDEF)-like protein